MSGSIAPLGRGPRGEPGILVFAPSLVVGGAERHAADLVRLLRERGFPCRILVHAAQVSDVVAAMPGARDSIVLRLRGISEAAGWVRIWRILRSLRPDILLAVNQTMLIVGVVQRWIGASRAPIACVFHSTELQEHERYQEKIFRVLSPMIDLLVYVGDTQQRIWAERGVRPRRAVVIRNGINLDRFAGVDGAAVRGRLGIGADEFVLGIVATLRPEKNHVELVRGLRAAMDRGIAARVLAVGKGPMLPVVQALARELGVADRVILVGEQADVAPYIAACDVGVLCSTAETFPLSAIEFLAAGRPMIASRVGGVPDIVSDGVNGRLYRSGDPGDLAAVIGELANAGYRATLAAAAGPSVEALSAERMADDYAAALTALVGTAGRR